MHKLKLYLAHPLTGLQYSETMRYYRWCKAVLGEMYELLCPMVAKERLKDEPLTSVLKDKYDSTLSPVVVSHAIVERDRWMVSQSDVVLIDFSGSQKVSIGCVSELAWAGLLNKHTIVVLPEGNCHSHAFVRENADIVFDNMEQAIGYLQKLYIGISEGD